MKFEDSRSLIPTNISIILSVGLSDRGFSKIMVGIGDWE